MSFPTLLGYCWIPTTIGYLKTPIFQCTEGATSLNFYAEVGESIEGSVWLSSYGNDTYEGTEYYKTNEFNILGKTNGYRVTYVNVNDGINTYIRFTNNNILSGGVSKSTNFYGNSILFLATYDNIHYYIGFAGSTKWYGKSYNSTFDFSPLPSGNTFGYCKLTAIYETDYRWYLHSFDELDDIIQNAKFIEIKPTKFYLSSPEFGHPMRRGESVELVFTEEYSDGTVVTPAAFHVLNEEKPDKYGRTNWTLSGSTLTVTEECWLNTVFLAVEPADNIVLITDVNITVLNPTPPPSSSNPYLPPDGGISGGGNQSNISTVTGTFDAQPGPSIVENLPNGSSGADIASSGMYTKYLCNNALLNLLAEFFWEDNIGIQALKAVLGNPIDSIISLTVYPFALDTLVPTTQTTIYFGQYDSHFAAFSLTKSSFQIDWGTVTIPFFWGSFLDYSPYTKIQLYLPWGVGFVSIDPNEVVPWSSKNSYNKADFVNGTIRVITNIELDKGACVHNIVGNNGRVIGSFGGIVGKQVPVTGSDNSARILAMISAAVSSSAAIGTSAGGTLAAGKNLAYGKGMSMAERAEGREMIGNYKSYVGNTVQSLSNALSSPPSYPRAGTFSDATNTLGYQYPYLIISRPSQSVPQQYGRFMGYPSNIFHAHLGEVRGYTEVSSIHLDNITATANELDELESILKGGVLL